MNSSLKKYTVVTTRVNSQKSRNFQYKLSSYCMTQHLSNSVHYKKGFLSNKVDGISKWFDEFTGMHEVRIAQSRVLNEEQNFRKSQEVRRNVLGELNEIQKKIKDVYAELETINRTDEKYVTLVALEHKLLKEEKSALEKFTQAEKFERDCFSNLSNSVKLSHEQERVQRERTKYWSIIGSVMGTIIGIMGTLITNRSKMNELKELINDSSDKKLIDNLKVLLEKNDLFLNKLSTIEQIKTLPANCDKIENLLNKINAIENHLETKTITINDARKSSEAFFEDRPESLNEMGSIAAVRETMSNEFTNVKTLIIVLAAVSIIMPLIKNNLF